MRFSLRLPKRYQSSADYMRMRFSLYDFLLAHPRKEQKAPQLSWNGIIMIQYYYGWRPWGRTVRFSTPQGFKTIKGVYLEIRLVLLARVSNNVFMLLRFYPTRKLRIFRLTSLGNFQLASED